jgi:spore germination cell wall hydrolase CwlJ-like protein
MLAVANVVLNRVKSDAYYHVNTIEEVIFDKMWAVQFSVTIKNKKTGKSMMDKALESYDSGKFSGKNPKAEKKAMEKAIKAAKEALNGKNNIGDYLCFRLNNSGAKKIKKKYSDYRIIGDHIFYRTK